MGNNSIVFGEFRLGNIYFSLTSNERESEYFVDVFVDDKIHPYSKKTCYDSKRKAIQNFLKEISLIDHKPLKLNPVIDILN